MRKLIVLILWFFSSIALFGQTTAVTATITDSDSTVWINPQWSVQFVPNPNFPQLSSYSIGGVPITSNTYSQYIQVSGTGNGSGVISTTLLDNDQVLPAGSTYRFVVQSQTSAPATTYNPVKVTGASQSLTSFLSTNSTAPRFPAITGAFGYADIEINIIPQPGGYYYNVVNAVQRVWNGVAWTNGGGGASGSSFGLLNFPAVASATTPLYLVGHFRDDTQQFFLSYSADAKNFVQLNTTPYSSFLPTGGVRDIGAVYVPAQSKFYFTGTCCNNGTFWYWTSTDLQTFSAGTAITTGVGVGNTQWSPHFAIDATGNYDSIVGGCASSCSTATDFYIATFTPSTETFGTYNHITLNGESGVTGLFDFRSTWDPGNSLYYGVYTSQTAGPSQYIHIATASSIGGAYTRINAGTTDFFGFGPNSENPDVVLLPNGNYRVYADIYTTLGGNRLYTRKWVDATPNFASVIGTPAVVNGPEQEGGTNITITSPAVATIVYNSAATQPNPVNSLLSGHGINGGPNAAYSIFLNNFANSSYPNAFNSTGASSIGLQNSIGNVGVLSSHGIGILCLGQFPGDCTGGLSVPTFSDSNTWGTNAAFFVNSNNVAGFTFNELPGTNGKIWSHYAQAGVDLVYDNTDDTTPFAMVGVPTTYNNLIKIGANSQWCWDSTAHYASQSNVCDTGISRNASGTVSIGNGTQGDHSGRLLLGGLTFNGGTIPTITGCGTISSQLGGTSGGSFVTSTTGTCTAVLTGLKTVADGYHCDVMDQTQGIRLNQTANTASSCTVTGTTVANDILVFTAIGW